ncbi:hypothetical protein ACQ4PT_069692 [Festuca glaucescens]
MAISPRNSKIRSSTPRLHGELLVDEILTRLPIAAAVRFQAVCKEWHAALTSDHFVAAHAARAAAARQPEIVFFSPTRRGTATSFYACSLPADGGAAVAAPRELLTVGDLVGENIVLSGNKPCRGLTLVFDVRLSEYYVFNFSTGEHAALPPCEPAEEIREAFPRFRRFRLELSSTGLGFDPAAGEHKVVRFFRNTFGQQKCEVCALTASGVWQWRPCAGGDAPPSFACHVDDTPPVALDDGYLYWLLHPSSFADGSTTRRDPPHDAPIMSLSVGAERFGDAEGKKKKVLLATSRHKVLAYDTESGGAEEVFDMNCYVDVPLRNSEARLLVSIGLHEERIASVGRTLAGGTRLQVKRGRDTVVGKREVSSEVYQKPVDQDEEYREFREFIMQLAYPMQE